MHDFYIYTADTFDATKLAQVHTITPEVQAASRYKFPYARVCLVRKTAKTPAVFCAIGKWANWPKYQKPGLLNAMCGVVPGLHKAVCVYEKQDPPPSDRPAKLAEEAGEARLNNLRDFCESVCIATGMKEVDLKDTSLDRLIKITSYSTARMLPLADFLAAEEVNAANEAPTAFTPGDLADFDRWHCEKNPGE